jgi:hypothetical protein
MAYILYNNRATSQKFIQATLHMEPLFYLFLLKKFFMCIYEMRMVMGHGWLGLEYENLACTSGALSS